MTKVIKKLPRLRELKDSVLQSIYNECNGVFHEQERFVTESDIMHNGEMIGSVKYNVTVETLIPSFAGDYENAPEAGEYDFILQNAKIGMILNDDCTPRLKLTNAINHLLSLEAGVILNS